MKALQWWLLNNLAVIEPKTLFQNATANLSLSPQKLAILASMLPIFGRLSCLSISFSFSFHRFIIRKNNSSPFRNTFTLRYEWFLTPYGWPPQVRERQIDETRNELMCINRVTLSKFLNKKHRANLFVRLNCSMKTNWCWQFAEKKIYWTGKGAGYTDKEWKRRRERRGGWWWWWVNESASESDHTKQTMNKWNNRRKREKKQLNDALTNKKKKKKSA